MSGTTGMALALLIGVSAAGTAHARTNAQQRRTEIPDGAAQKIISSTVRALTGWKSVDVRLDDKLVVMRHMPFSGRWAERSKTYVAQVKDPGRSKWNFSTIIGTIDVGVHPAAPFPRRGGADRLYQFVTPQLFNGHSYRPLSSVVSKGHKRPSVRRNVPRRRVLRRLRPIPAAR